jgi:hypothetical protein
MNQPKMTSLRHSEILRLWHRTNVILSYIFVGEVTDKYAKPIVDETVGWVAWVCRHRVIVTLKMSARPYDVSACVRDHLGEPRRSGPNSSSRFRSSNPPNPRTITGVGTEAMTAYRRFAMESVRWAGRPPESTGPRRHCQCASAWARPTRTVQSKTPSADPSCPVTRSPALHLTSLLYWAPRYPFTHPFAMLCA